jgi:hypothetical protein
MHVIPIISGAAWLWMLAVLIPSPRYCYVFAVVVGLAFIWIVLAISKKMSDKAHPSAK